MALNTERVVVVGNGMAGLAAVQEILRKKKKNLELVVFGDEPYPSYNRILLSDALSGKKGFSQLTMKPRKWYEENSVTLHTGSKVVEINLKKGRVYTENGFSSYFDKILIATGSLPFIPPIKGTDKKSVFVYRTVEDVCGMIEAARYKKKAVVIGGGLLGLEAAKALKDDGMEVSVVHLLDRLMEQQLDFAAAALLKNQLERMGIEVLMERATEEILGNGSVQGVRFKGGEILEADLVLICTGIKPNTEVAKKAGLLTNRGVLVNDYMETSAQSIYAVGECVEHRGRTYGLFDPLIEQAKVVADSIAGSAEATYEGSVVSAVLKVAGVNLVSIGNFLGGEGCEELTFTDPEIGQYKKVVLQNNRAVGAILMGDTADYRRLFKHVIEGSDVSEKRKNLLWGEPVPVKIAAESIEEEATFELGVDIPLVPEDPKPHYVTDNDRQRARETKWLQKINSAKIKADGLDVDWERYRREGASVIPPEDLFRIKLHGYCSQKQDGFFMRRIRVPGGDLSAAQFEQVARLGQDVGGWVHVTTRQNLELHWTRIEDSEKIDKALKDVGLTTRSSCGHTFRNIMTCEDAGISREAAFDVLPWVKIANDYIVSNSATINPKMPRRLNVFYCGCAGGCKATARLNDIAFVPVRAKYRGEIIHGFELWVGGSLGAKPQLAEKLFDFLLPEQSLSALQTVTEIYMRHGHLPGKANPRLKFLIEEWGFNRFRDEFMSLFRSRNPFLEGLEVLPFEGESHVELSAEGVYPQIQKDYYRVVVRVPLGELTSEQAIGLSRLSLEYGNGRLKTTKHQNVEFHWVKREKLMKLIKGLREIGLSPKGAGSVLDVVACSGTTFCIWGVSDAQGLGDSLIRHVAQRKEYLEDGEIRKLKIQISGCPNSCSLHQISDIGLSGSNGKYFLYLGGHMNGDATLGAVVRHNILPDEMPATIDGVFGMYKDSRAEGEGFSAFVDRLGAQELTKLLAERLDSPEAKEARAKAAERLEYQAVKETAAKEFSLKFKIDGKTTVVKAKNTDKILQRGLDEGLNLPYSCQAGSCGTCKLRVKGKFHQGSVEAITPEEVATGYSLICMAEPRGDMEIEV
ncbi:MAG: FAD-dependent oxidoreductase [Deltaproteobacteria bacterium]